MKQHRTQTAFIRGVLVATLFWLTMLVLAVVIRTGSSEKRLTQAKLDQMSRLPIRLLGAILNDVDPRDSYHYYYSSYLPGYEPVPTEEDGEGVQLVDSGGDR